MNHREPVAAVKYAGPVDDLIRHEGEPGLFVIIDAHPSARAIAFICPCGCQAFRRLPVHQDGDQTSTAGKWLWNGNTDRPTVYPSIRDVGACKWHGYLRDGIFEPVGDSGR